MTTKINTEVPMHLIADINIIDFLSKVKNCQSDIFFSTPEGDMLNLKSELARYVFVSINKHSDFILNGTVLCTHSEDLELLRPFISKK